MVRPALVDLPAPAPQHFDRLADIAAETLWLRPLGFLSGDTAAAAVAEGEALPLAGGGIAFTLVEALALHAGAGGPTDGESSVIRSAIGTPAALRAWAQGRGPSLGRRVERQLHRLCAPRPAWAGFRLERPLLMGIVNVTPDSFSDGGQFLAAEHALAQGRALLAAGADLLDIGGESTRPGAPPVPAEEQLRRVEPVIRTLSGEGAVISVDTRSGAVMRAAIAAGARIINDVSALTGDPESLAAAAATGAPLVLMHMLGDPQTMQNDPHYRLASVDIVEYLEARIAACAAAGIPRERIVVDPGIGFGKRSVHNLEIMARLALFHALGCGVLLGVSRKSLIGAVGGAAQPQDRIPGSLAGALHGLGQGVQILRVHDVAETRQAVSLWQAMAGGA